MSLPIKVRMTAWYVTLLAVILAGLASFLLIRMNSDLLGAIDHSLETRAAQIAGSSTENANGAGTGTGSFQDVSESSLVAVPRGETADQILSPTGVVLQAAGRGEHAVSGAPMIGRTDLARAMAGARVRITAPLGPDHELFRILAVRIHGSRQVLVVSESTEVVGASIHRLLVLILLAGPAALLAAGAGGWWLTRKALRPVSTMTGEAAAIGVERLDQRVAVPNTSDEIERLGRTLNAMLDRLEQGVNEKRRFLADASHELRTPLAVMRSEIDVSLRSDDLSPASRDVLRSASEEVDRMTGIVESLLTLARIDEGGLRLHRTAVALSEVAGDVTAKLRPLADAKHIHLAVEGDGAIVQADRDRLYQAVANLVDNAVKYTGPGGDVVVSIWARDDESGLTVADSGPGIPKNVLPRIFDRFVRVDAARARAGGGSGLGLAIFREIVEVHGGRVWAESELGRGSSFSFALPSAT